MIVHIYIMANIKLQTGGLSKAKLKLQPGGLYATDRAEELELEILAADLSKHYGRNITTEKLFKFMVWNLLTHSDELFE